MFEKLEHSYTQTPAYGQDGGQRGIGFAALNLSYKRAMQAGD